MKTVKFVVDDKMQREFAAAVRKNVNAYFTDNNISPKGDATIVIQSVTMLSLYLVPFMVLLFVPMGAWPAFLLVVLMGIGMAGVGMCIMHDAVHSSYSKAEKINKFLSFFSMFLLGSSVFTWKIQHNILHHTYTNIDGHDHDIDSKGPIRLSDHVPVKPIHRFQYLHAFFFYGLMSFSKLMSDFRQMREYTREGFSKRYNINPTTAYIRMVVAKIGYLALFIGLPVWLTPFSGWQIFSAFMIMHWTGGFIMSTIFQMAHIVEGASQYELAESGVVPTDWAVHQLYTTSDFARGNQFLNWYVGGLNFQIEHHLFPNISHVHYQKIAPIVERTALEYGLFYNLKPTLSSAFWSHVRRLKQLGGVPV